MKRNLIQLGVAASLLSLIGLCLLFCSRASRASEMGRASVGVSVKPCSESTLSGRYAAVGSGTKALGGVGPISIVGSGDFDGTGAMTGSDTASLNGEIFHRSYTGTYQVNDNCTGSFTLVLPPPRNIEAHFDFVIVDDGDQAFFIQTDPGTDLTVEIKRQ